MDDNSGLTATNMTVGSLAYAPPEQLMGASLDGRTDQYALAATAFQLLTGKPPFDDSNAAVVISSHLSSPPPRMADRRPDLSHLDPIISKAMAKESADRYPTCRDFATALSERIEATPQADHATMVAAPAAQALAGQPTQLAAAAPSAPPAPAADAKPLGSKRIWLVTAAIGVALLVAAGVVFVPRMMGSGSDEKPAPAEAPTAAPASPTEASAPLVQPAAVSALLLTPQQVSDVVGETLQESSVSSAVADAASEFNRPECTAAIYPLEARMYGPVRLHGGAAKPIVPPEGSPSNHIVDQSVALMPSAERAEAFRADSQREWQACAGIPVTITGDGYTTRPTLADVRAQGNLIVQDRTVTGDTAPGQRCQHTLGVWSNVVAEAVVCDDKDIGDQSQKVVNEILANAKRS